MDRKTLDAIVTAIIDQVVAAHPELSKGEATTFVGVALRSNKDAFVASVAVPKLAVQPAA
jgi:hypothetical protein